VYRRHRWREDETDDRAAQRQTASLAGVAVILLLLVGGLFLVQQLRSASVIEDCLMAGRRNCNVLVTGPH
jgi:hypothetical protein